jgi:hypothetical protein
MVVIIFWKKKREKQCNNRDMAMTIAFILKREGETVLKPFFFKIVLPTIDLTLNGEQDME